MTDEVSIWRWQVEDDLEAQFAQLIAADAEGFNRIAAQMAGDGAPDFAADQAETEAKIRAMDLPPDVLETTLEGFRAMVAEAQEERAALEAEFAEEQGESDARSGVALASSHLFYDDPYASLAYEEIDRQADALVGVYRAAITRAVGDKGQDFMSYLGATSGQFDQSAAFDALLDAGLAGVLWIWVKGDAAYCLSKWQDDKELPIDLEFYRIPTAEMAALRD